MVDFQILHSLFSVLDPPRCADAFRDCFPVVEKRQEAEFRRAVNAWYREVQVL